MSTKLDQELAEAIVGKGGEGDAPAVAKPVMPERRAAPPQKKSIGLLATLLALVGAVVALFMVGFKEAAVYATPVDKLVHDQKGLVGRKVRVEGELVPGTLVKRDQPCEYRFTIHKEQDQLPVRYKQCVIPDTFRDVPGGGVNVTIEGALNAQGEFDASLVMAKCASKYDPNTHQMKDGPGNMPVN
ncbi:MAG: cytochrome c maturation protein CcmE [Minicystis sp.]